MFFSLRFHVYSGNLNNDIRPGVGALFLSVLKKIKLFIEKNPIGKKM